MKRLEILQGQAGYFTIEIESADNLSDYSGYAVIVSDAKFNHVIKFSKNPKEDYELLDTSEESQSKTKFIIPPECTKKYADEQLYYIFITQQGSGSDFFPSGTKKPQPLVFINRSSLPIIPDFS